MLHMPQNLKECRILIANDDSIHAEGIKILEEIALSITPHVWVVAPENQQSAVGHSLTINAPLRIKKYDDRHFSVYGTPTDSVLVGVREIMRDARPDLVLSGINHGQNTADDVTYSGTIAAAIEAVLMNIPAIGFSQDYDENGGKPDWTHARHYIPQILSSLQGMDWNDHVVISANIPRSIKGYTPKICAVPQGHYSMEKQEMVRSVDPRGRPYFWIGAPPERDIEDQTHDVGALRAGNVTLTPLSLNLTDQTTLAALKKRNP